MHPLREFGPMEVQSLTDISGQITLSSELTHDIDPVWSFRNVHWEPVRPSCPPTLPNHVALWHILGRPRDGMSMFCSLWWRFDSRR